jgi:diguanylate cyclase (GGDEF)-like protein
MSQQKLENLTSLVDSIDAKRKQAGHVGIGLLVGKLTGLSKLNQRFGYRAGDIAIDIFHQKLRAIARERDESVRISGTTFAFLIDNPLHEGHVLLAAEKVAQLAEDWIVVAETRLRLGVHVGVSLLPALALSGQDLLAQAERAQRLSQSSGERFSLYHDGIAIENGTLTHPLFDAKSAIENGEFRVHFQPKVSLETGGVVGAEALVRWQSPDGLISPANFLSEIERSRAMGPLLQFVVNSAAREVANWVKISPNFSISINATTSDIEDADLVEVLTDVLQVWGISPRHLVMEVTETMLMKDVDRGVHTLRKLRELGIHTSIDDFGTGYSSLAYLHDLPVNEIKIDQRFVRRIVEDATDSRIVKSLIALAHAMDLSVVAEGIEDAAVADALVAMDCDIGQGYFYGKPVTAAEFEKTWLRGSRKYSPVTA